MFPGFPAVLHIDKAYSIEHDVPSLQELTIKQLIDHPKHIEYLKTALQTKDRLACQFSPEILQQLQKEDSEEAMNSNELLLRMYFKDMTWVFLSTIHDQLTSQSPLPLAIPLIDYANSKFNELFINNPKETARLYAKYMQTKSFKNVLASRSLAELFN